MSWANKAQRALTVTLRLSLAGPTAANPQRRRAAAGWDDRTDAQTDRRTHDSCINLAPHTVPIIYKRAQWPAKAKYKVQEETELEDLQEILRGLYVTTGGVRSGRAKYGHRSRYLSHASTPAEAGTRCSKPGGCKARL